MEHPRASSREKEHDMSLELAATVREEQGKGPSRRLRRTGSVPAVLYAAGKQPASLTVDPRALKKALSGPLGRNTLLEFKLPGGARTVLVKDLQFHPVKRELVHADFIEVDLKVPIRIEVPLVLSGKVKNLAAGAVVEQVARKIKVKALPSAIPEKIDVDVGELKMGQSIHMSDLKMPAGVTSLGAAKQTVVTVTMVKEEKVVEKVVADAAAAPGAAPAAGAAAPAAGAAGAKPAAGAAAPAAAGAKPAAAAPAKK